MVDYSKWKNIEVSDDEDDTHPNIDTPSLFRWRHQARVQRMEEFEREKNVIITKQQTISKEIQGMKEKIEKKDGNLGELTSKIRELETEKMRLKREEEELYNKEKKMPWNVDTLSKPGFEKTVINNPKGRPKDEELSEEEKEKKLKQFIKTNESFLKEYGLLRKYDDSKRFLMDHNQLVCEDTANYLVIWCIQLEMENKHDLMKHVAHQCICMQYILELSKQLDVDPRSCVSSFFSRIQVADVEYKSQFDSEIESFKERIQKRAQEKIKAMLEEQEEEERQARLGPGGLDPVEIFETLPKELQDCFEKRDVQLLQDVIANMDKAEASYHMKRCVDSGLWVADASTINEETTDNTNIQSNNETAESDSK